MNKSERPNLCSRIIIIGGGASGALTCAHLLAKANGHNIEINWIGNQSSFGRGIAYSTTNPHHLLNVRAGGMSAFLSQPLHFYEWAKLRQEVQPTDFLPRRLYGDYLEQLVPNQESRVKRWAGEAASVEKLDSGYRVTLKDGRHFQGDHVILAIGNLPSHGIAGAIDPWNLKTIDINDRVLLIGSRLTMIDAAITLCNRGLKNPVWAVSRRGALPEVHAIYSPHENPSPEFKSWLNLSPRPLRSAYRLFREECKRAVKQGSDWRAVFDLVRPVTPKIWSSLTAAEQRTFLRHVSRYWDIHRHRMAPEIANDLQKFQNDGSLVILGGSINLKKVDSSWHLLVEAHGQRYKNEFDVVVDCTGSPRDLNKVNSPLLHNLWQQAFLKLERPPIDIRPNSKFKGFHVIGPLLKGAEWEATAIPEIRRQAEEIAQRICSEVPKPFARSEVNV